MKHTKAKDANFKNIIITTQSFDDGKPTPYGLILEVIPNNGKVIRKLKIETPVESISGRIKPGLRGIYFWNEKYYTVSWNRVFVLDKDLKKIESSFSHKLMSDLHGIYVNHDGIWVTSTFNDGLILYGFDGKKKKAFWTSETNLYPEFKKVNTKKDWRFIGKEFRGFTKFHVNSVTIYRDSIFLTGRQGGLVEIDYNSFMIQKNSRNIDYNILSRKLNGPHDGLIIEDNIFFTETKTSSIVQLNLKGKIIKRKRIPVFKNYKNMFKAILSNKKQILRQFKIFKMYYWTRGLVFSSNHFIVGQSVLNGKKNQNARIVIFNNKLNFCAHHNLIVKNYPEMRIFQIIEKK